MIVRCEDRARHREGAFQTALVLVLVLSIISGSSAWAGEKESAPGSLRDKAIQMCNTADELTNKSESSKAISTYNEALTIFKELAEAHPNDTQSQHDLATVLSRMVWVFVQIGDGDKALEACQQSLDIENIVAAVEPGNDKFQYALYVSYLDLGDLCQWMGTEDKALAAFQQALALAQKRAAAADINTQCSLSLAYYKLQRLYIQMGKNSEATVAGHQVRKLYRQMVATDTHAWGALAETFEQLADRYLVIRQPKAAAEAYSQALEIDKWEAGKNPEAPQFQKNMSYLYTKLGNLYAQMGQIPQAFDAFNHDLEICRKLAAAAPDSIPAQRALATGFENLGDLYMHVNQPENARDAYQQIVEISRGMAQTHPEETIPRQDMVIGLYKLGRADEATALDHYKKALTLTGEINKKEPENSLIQGMSKDLTTAIEKIEAN